MSSEDVGDAAEEAADEFEDIDENGVDERTGRFFTGWLVGVFGFVLLIIISFAVAVYFDYVSIDLALSADLDVGQFIEIALWVVVIAFAAITFIAILVKAPGNYLAAISRAVAGYYEEEE